MSSKNNNKPKKQKPIIPETPSEEMYSVDIFSSEESDGAGEAHEPEWESILEKKEDARKKAPDIIPSAHDQDFFFGPRFTNAIYDNKIMYDRFGYKWAYKCPFTNCRTILDRMSGKKVGVIPRIRVNKTWEIVKRLHHNASDEAVAEKYGITFAEWQQGVRKMEDYFKKYIPDAQKSSGLLIHDMMNLPEFVFEALFIKKSEKLVELVRAAILADIRESERLKRRWKKIKVYPHKVSLSSDGGGIFDRADVAILNSHGIHSLNDIRKCNVYELKNMLLDHPLNRIVEEINLSFKEDLARRRDKRYKVYPFIYGNLALAAMTAIGYFFQYELLKETRMTLLINACACLWCLSLLYIFWGMLRVKRRRRRRPDYTYLTKPVKRAIKFLSLFAVFTIGSLTLFYQRYDGYDNLVYYRNIDENKIAVAGLKTEESLSALSIPSTIDGKLVVEIDIAAFREDDFKEVTLPTNLEKIDTYAFVGCESLEVVHVPSASFLSEINSHAFRDCVKLESINNLDRVTTVGTKAFSGCGSLESIEFATLSLLERAAFEDCYSLQSVDLGVNLRKLSKKTFANCSSLEGVLGFEYITSIEKEVFSHCTSLKNVNLSSALTIGDKAFYGCAAFDRIIVPDTVEEIGKDAFSSCYSVESITVPFIGKNRETSEKYSLDYYIDCSEDASDLDVTLTDIETVLGKTFNDCVSVKNVILPDSVTRIESGAFKGSGIESVNIPSGVTVIEEKVFMNCASLSLVSGGANVTSVEASAFDGCMSLTSIELPKVSSLGDAAFRDCRELSFFTVPSSLVDFGDYVFMNCYALTEMELSGLYVSSFGESVFKNCTALRSVNLPVNLEYIPASTFTGCSDLAAFNVSSNVTKIEKEAFLGSGIKSISLSSSVKEIGKKAFYGTNISILHVPDSVTKIGKNAFADCGALTSVTVPFLGESSENTGYGFRYLFGNSASIDSIEVTNLEAIGRTTFKGGEHLSAISITSGAKEIAYNAFRNFGALVSIALPDEIESIGRSAFKNCSSLRMIDLGSASVEKIGTNAFDGCSSLIYMRLPGTLTEIPKNMMRGCSSLQDVVLRDGIEKIGANAFRDCTGLTAVSLPNSIVEIGKGCMRDCTSLTDIILSESLSVIPKNAFYGCSSLEIAYITDQVTRIEKNAFYQCTDLKKLVLGDSVEEIGNSAFYHCYSLNTISFNNKVNVIAKKAFYNCSSIETLSLSDSVEVIEDMAFYGCEALTELSLGVNTKEIGSKAFYNCSALSSLLLNDGLTRIDYKAFGNCYNLYTVEIPDSVSKMGHGIFAGCRRLSKITTPFIGSSATFARKIAYLTDSESISSITVTNAKKIAASAFKGCAHLRYLSLNEGIEKIGDGVISGCSSLLYVYVPENLEEEYGHLFPEEIVFYY